MALIGGAAVTRSLVAVVRLAVCVICLLLSHRDRGSTPISNSIKFFLVFRAQFQG